MNCWNDQMLLATKELLLVICVVVANVSGQLFFKSAANSIDGERTVVSILHGLLFSPAMWGGVISCGVTMLAWVWVLRSVPLSVAYSAISLAFILVPLASVFVFGEMVSRQFVVGALFISIGILLVCFQQA